MASGVGGGGQVVFNQIGGALFSIIRWDCTNLSNYRRLQAAGGCNVSLGREQKNRSFTAVAAPMAPCPIPLTGGTKARCPIEHRHIRGKEDGFNGKT